MAASTCAKRLLTINELSQVSGVPVVTLRRYAKRGKIKAFQPGGPRCKLLFRPDALEQHDNPLPGQTDQTSEGASSNLERLPGRRPGWMNSTPEKQDS